MMVVAIGLGAYLAILAAIGLTARPKRADLAVVFGNSVVAGRPSPRLRARLDVSIGLLRAGAVSRILVSGGVDTLGQDEAAVMATYLIDHGIPPTAVLQDPLGRDTLATARNTAALTGTTGSVVVVTQWFHIPRAMLALRRAGVRHVSGAWPRFAEWRDLYSFVRESVALPAYAFKRVGGAAAAGTGRQSP